MKSAPSLPRENFTAMLRLDHNRALSQLAAKTGKPVAAIRKLAVWGNHIPSMYADYRFATIDGASVKDMINDHAWNKDVFLPTVGKRGAAIIEARGLSSAACAANAAIDHMHDWALGTGGEWVTMGVPSNGEYGIPKDVMFGYPVTCEGGEYKIVAGPADRRILPGLHRQDPGRADRASRTASSTCCNLAAQARPARQRAGLFRFRPPPRPRRCPPAPPTALFDPPRPTPPRCRCATTTAASRRACARAWSCRPRSARCSTSRWTTRTAHRWAARSSRRICIVGLLAGAAQPPRPRRRAPAAGRRTRASRTWRRIVLRSPRAPAYLMLPKPQGLADVQRAAQAIDALGGAAVPLHALVETHGALHEVFAIAAHPRIESLSFGLMDFVSAHRGAIPQSAMGAAGPVRPPADRSRQAGDRGRLPCPRQGAVA